MLKASVKFCVLLAASWLWCQPASAQDGQDDHVVDATDDSAPAGMPTDSTADLSIDSPADLPTGTPEPISGGSGMTDTGWDFWTSPTLTGDWFGLRPSLKESGIRFAGRVTQFAFGLSGGINTPPPPPLGEGDTFKYTGRGEYDMFVDLEKFGGLPKGTLLVRAEHWYGQYGNVSLNTGAFAPSVFPAALPPAANDPGVPFITNFLVTQPLSKNLVVFAGKKDVLGGADQDKFSGGDGTQQFVNQALIANPAFLEGLPYTSFVAGAVTPQEWGAASFFVRDPQDRTTEFFRLDNLFAKGVILGGEVRLKTNFFSLPGDQHIGAIWKHFAQPNLSFSAPPPGVYPEPESPHSPTLDNAYTIYYGFDQYFVRYSSDSDRGWGLFGRASISDGNPTPTRYFLSTGLGGYSPVGRQRGDTFGLGWFFVGASTQFGPIQQFVFGPRDGSGLELFYNFQVTPWLNVTPDVQFLRPGAGAIATDAFQAGIRVNMKL